MGPGNSVEEVMAFNLSGQGGLRYVHVDHLQARLVYPEVLTETEALEEPIAEEPSTERMPVPEPEIPLPTPLNPSPVLVNELGITPLVQELPQVEGAVIDTQKYQIQKEMGRWSETPSRYA